ncbi:MAG: hypothetical protein AAF368_17200, partial [Planctomycetota bacterium]
GFILPWILAMAAIPLELLVMSGSAITVALLALSLLFVGGVLRVLGHGLRHTFSGLRFLYDAYIAIPLLLERLFLRRKSERASDVDSELEPIPDVSWKITDEFKARP